MIKRTYTNQSIANSRDIWLAGMPIIDNNRIMLTIRPPGIPPPPFEEKLKKNNLKIWGIIKLKEKYNHWRGQKRLTCW